MLLLPKPLKGKPADDSDTKEYEEGYDEVVKKIKGTQPVFPSL